MTADEEKSAPPLFVLHEHASSVLCCGFYPSSTYERERSSWFLSGDVDGTVIVWNLLTRRPLIAFAAAEEARRQLSESLRQANCAGGGADDSQGTPSSSTSFAALGPHSRSVLSVGFIPASASSLLASQREVGVPSQETAGSVVPEKPSDNASQEVALAALAPGALPVSASHLVGPQRQRFRLSRRPVPRSSDNAHSSSATGSASDEKPLLEAPPLASSMCFYTHCRDQRVYVWSFSTSTVTLRLMAALTAPQHGFCPAESASIVENAVPKTFLAVPHDTNGEVSVWEMQWKTAVLGRKSDLESHNSPTEESCTKADDAGGKGEYKSDCEEDEEEVDVTGMSPMDALIARAAAQERRDAKKRSAHFGDSVAEHPVEGSGSSSSSATVIKRTQRSSFLCFVAPFATSRECGFSVRLLCTFTACPHFKGGTIMRLTMCGDAQHITVAFESGHVVLVRFRSDVLIANGAADLNVEERAFLKQHETPNNVPALRCVVRAFAESALACWWSGRRVLACSAEGALHCYEVALASTDVARDAQPCAVDAPLQLQLVWSSALRRGIGSVCLQANLVIAGCWDSTLRLYDARDGHLVSILSYQREVINEVTVAPPAIARAAAFGFDTRHPRCYAPQPEQLHSAGTRGQLLDASAGPGNVEGKGIALAEPPALQSCGPHEEEELVYLFGSASKDGSVAVWRVDMQLIAEKAAMQQLLL